MSRRLALRQLNFVATSKTINNAARSEDHNDEPASVCLDRMRREREKFVKSRKIKKGKNPSVIFRGGDNLFYEKQGLVTRSLQEELPFEIPENWAWARWGNLSESIQYGYNAPAKECGIVRLVRISDIQNDNIQWDNVPFCDSFKSQRAIILLAITPISYHPFWRK